MPKMEQFLYFLNFLLQKEIEKVELRLLHRKTVLLRQRRDEAREGTGGEYIIWR